MTKPVDTDALRAAATKAQDVIEIAISWAESEGAGPDSDEQQAVDALLSLAAAAADEVDQLRVRCEHLDGEHEQVKANRDQIIADYQRLRVVIENAPHDADCWLLEDPDEGVLPSHRRCTCWKADAL